MASISPARLWAMAEEQHPHDKTARALLYVELMRKAGHVVPTVHSDETWKRTAAKLAYLLAIKEFPELDAEGQETQAAAILIGCLDIEEAKA